MVKNDKYYICGICGKRVGSRGLPNHLRYKHSISLKEYYDKFYKKEDEGFCQTCGKPLPFKGISIGYNRFCSNSCIRKNKDIIEKTKKTNLEKYGTEWQVASKSTRQKSIKTCMEHYGVPYNLQAKEIREQILNTCNKKYGGNAPYCCEEVKTKGKATFKRHCEDPNFLKNINIKMKNTLLERYGNENYVNVDKCKETCLKKYGVENPYQSEEIKEKIKQTMLERYGVENYSQTREFHKKRSRKYIYNDLTFDSSYELCFYKYCIDHHINIKQSTDVFNYEYAGIIHKYFPDFKINNTNIEIKGKHFFEDGKMINPYDRSQDKLYEAKHQCMIKNNVKIIVNCDKYIEYVNTLDKMFLEKYKFKLEED